MTDPLISIVILTHNSRRYIKNCLDSVLKLNYRPVEIIVSDNNSSDGTLEILNAYRNKADLIKLSTNLGYAVSNNLCINRSKGKYIFVLNPDTEVDKNCLDVLVEQMEQDNSVGACQPLVYLLNDRKKVNLTGKETNFLGFDWIRDYKNPILPKTGEIMSFSGSGVLLRRSALEKTGLFDPLYFMYYEDSDLSWRMRLFGYKIRFIPQSIIYHDYKFIPDGKNQSLKNKIFYNERNRLITIIKNYQLSTLIILIPIILFIEICLITYSLSNGWFIKKMGSYFSILRNIHKILKGRNFVQKNRIKTDREITSKFKYRLGYVYQILPVKLFINPLLEIYWGITRRLI